MRFLAALPCRSLSVALVLIAAVPCPLASSGQQPAAERSVQDKPTIDWQQAARAALAAGTDDQRRAALQTAVDGDYARAFACWQGLPAGRERELLGAALRLSSLRDAEVVVSATLGDVEAVQGGVVDYHWLVVHFRQVEVVQAPDDVAAAIRADRVFHVLRGTHEDAWLAARLRHDLTQVVGPHVFCFRAHDYRHAAAAVPPTGVTVQEYEILPAAAADAVRVVRGR